MDKANEIKRLEHEIEVLDREFKKLNNMYVEIAKEIDETDSLDFEVLDFLYVQLDNIGEGIYNLRNNIGKRVLKLHHLREASNQ